jgi:hypothetical protein
MFQTLFIKNFSVLEKKRMKEKMKKKKKKKNRRKTNEGTFYSMLNFLI